MVVVWCLWCGVWVVLLFVLCVLVVCVLLLLFVCVLCVVWHAENRRVKIPTRVRVSIQNVPVCTGTTFTC